METKEQESKDSPARQKQSRATVWMETKLRQRLDELAAATGQPIGQIVADIVRDKLLDEPTTLLNRTAKVEQLLARLDGRHRSESRVLKEMLGSLVYILLLYQPELPAANKEAAHASALRRMSKFIELVTHNLKAGQSLLSIDEPLPVDHGPEVQTTERESS
jgi:hypothetical protein